MVTQPCNPRDVAKITVKICGLRDAEAVNAAVTGGASYVGFVFCPDARRQIDASLAASLIALLPPAIVPVGLFVDPDDREIACILGKTPLRLIQLHGNETPERVRAVKNMTGLPVMKAIGIADARDIDKVRLYEEVSDMLLFDAKPAADGQRGGNGMVFNWNLLQGVSFAKPWMLAGGLNAGNIAVAVAATGAGILDVSSGVEDAAGVKNPLKIKAFLAAAHQIETCC